MPYLRRRPHADRSPTPGQPRQRQKKLRTQDRRRQGQEPAQRPQARPARQTVNPVLPQEDPAELEAKIQEWLDDHQPTNAVERDLVTRAARLSWTLDRAERYETALLSKQVRKAMLGSRAKRTEKVCELARKLFYMAGKRLLPDSGPAWADNPSAFVARLEESPEGAQWLLDRWVEMRCLLISDENWTFLDQFKFVRLLGKQPINAIDDPELNEIFLAWETIEDQWGTRFWLQMQELTPYEDPAFSAWRVWREIVPRPEVPEAAVAFLLGIAQREIERLQELIVDLEEIEGDDALELAEQASFCASDAAERLRRFQTARTRELLRTIDLLAKLRKADAPKPEKKATKEPNPPAAQNAGPSPLALPLRADRNPCRRRHDRLPGEAPGGGRTAFPKAKNRRERTHFGAALDPRNTSPTRERGKRLGTFARPSASDMNPPWAPRRASIRRSRSDCTTCRTKPTDKRRKSFCIQRLSTTRLLSPSANEPDSW